MTDYAAYVGGPSGAADPSLEPIKIGYLNQEGGPVVIGSPVTTPARNDGQVHQRAGRRHRRPSGRDRECFVAQNEEEGQQCGQQFANDPDIVAIVTGAVAVGSESLHAALAGSKPVIVGCRSTRSTPRRNAAILFGDSQYILAPYATFARDVLGAQSAALIYPEGAGQDSAAARSGHRVRGSRNPGRGCVLSRNTPT